MNQIFDRQQTMKPQVHRNLLKRVMLDMTPHASEKTKDKTDAQKPQLQYTQQTSKKETSLNTRNND